MALTQPQLAKIDSFDINDGILNRFKLALSGSVDVSKAQLRIYDNLTAILVYSNDNVGLVKASTSGDLSTYTFPNYNYITSIQNGNTYYMTVAVATNVLPTVWSPTSNGTIFSCYTTPHFTFRNIASGTIFSQSNFTVALSYEQAEGELLNSYNLQLYKVVGSTQTLLRTSPTLYDNNYLYTFQNIPTIPSESTTTYYKIIVNGNTIGGTQFSNTSSLFKVSYTIYANSPLLTINNYYSEGYISIQSNITNIMGVANPPLIIPYNNVDLTAVGSSVKWSNSFSFSDDYTVQFWLKKLTLWSEFSYMSGDTDNDKLSLYYIVDPRDSTKIRIALYAYTAYASYPYYLESNAIKAPLATEFLYINFRINKGLYELYVENIGGTYPPTI